MRVSVAGLPFDVAPAASLSRRERASLVRFDAGSDGDTLVARPFVLEIGEEVSQPVALHGPLSGAGPAEVVTAGGNVRLHHRDFSARLDMTAGRGTLSRDTELEFPLEITMRTAMCCQMPLLGGVALHAAGLVIDGRGVVFFGPSGAGKTTITRQSPFPALSDELVAVHGAPWRVRATGFWGELSERDVDHGAVPVAGLVALAKGPELELSRIGPMEAFRQLLTVLVLPDAPPLWRRATSVLAQLVHEVPCWTMAWSPGQPPWTAVTEALDRAPGERQRGSRSSEGGRDVV